jgi:hypothetical protein
MIYFKDVNDLEGKLRRLSNIRFEAVIKKNMTQIFNRGKSGGTPVDTGELVGSLSQSQDEVGYTKDYAPHVEYGHRLVNGGYVPGQYFLKKNVEAQRPIYRQDLIDQLRKA